MHVHTYIKHKITLFVSIMGPRIDLNNHKAPPTLTQHPPTHTCFMFPPTHSHSTPPTHTAPPTHSHGTPHTLTWHVTCHRGCTWLPTPIWWRGAGTPHHRGHAQCSGCGRSPSLLSRPLHHRWRELIIIYNLIKTWDKSYPPSHTHTPSRPHTHTLPLHTVLWHVDGDDHGTVGHLPWGHLQRIDKFQNFKVSGW